MLESLICLGQYFGMLQSQNHFFKVTGTWANPNVTAMFIAMAIPAFFAMLHSRLKTSKGLLWTSFAILCASLVLLNCRTAWIGLIITVLIQITRHYGLVKKFRVLTTSRKATLAATAAGIVLLAGILLYNHKKSSADGRLLIWKISAQMISKKPLTGFGYGMFERDYNLFQADYFSSGKGNALEKANAGYVHMGYNEFLQNAVEGGALGVLLLCALFYSLLRLPVLRGGNDNKENEELVAAYCGVLIFMAMSLVNFTMQAIPAMCVFVVYGALLAGAPCQRRLLAISYLPGKLGMRRVAGGLVMVIGLLLSWSSFQTIRASYFNKQASLQSSNGTAIKMLASFANDLNHYESYWTNYGNVLFKQGDYVGALSKYAHATLLTSDPELYLKTGICYERLNRLDEAIKNYQQSAWLDPNRMEPRIALMRIYWKLKDTVNTVNTANEIITMPVKVASGRASYYQQQALNALRLAGANISSADAVININNNSLHQN